jgi:phosphatidylinositol glycan class F
MPTALPLKDYFSSLAYLGLLLSTCVVVLPRSTAYFYPSFIDTALASRSSADRPEHPWLTPFTASAAGTTAWVALGVAITMLWWGAKLGNWWGATMDRKVSEARVAWTAHRPQTTCRRWSLMLTTERAQQAVIATAGTTLLFALALHLLGAPAAAFVRTLLFSLNLALLTAWPIVAALGIPSIYDDGIAARYRLTRLLCAWRAEDAHERALAYPVAGTLVGAWIGAIPIPLDWDRPWQTYPLTPLVGALVGFLAGGYVSFAASAYESLRNDVMAEQAAAAKSQPAPKKSRGRKVKSK